ncbi:MAG: NAD+ synthase [Phycisphaerales bacterium]
MRLALAQINPTVGDLAGNAQRIAHWIGKAREAGADLVALPELCLCGYPPKDLLLEEGFVGACVREAQRLGESATAGICVVFGTPLPVQDGKFDGPIANSLLVYRDGRYVDRYDKRLLPTYDVFDEDRYFTPGDRAVVIEVGRDRAKVGLAICEDLWKGEDAGFSARYRDRPDPVALLAASGAEVLVVPSASPFVLGKGRRHRDILKRHATTHGLCVASVNQVGGNDDLVFDGHSALFAPDGTLAAAAPGFEEGLIVLDTGGTSSPSAPDPLLSAGNEELLFKALVTGTRDYVRKTGHTAVIIGLSGGIDSAVTAAIAVAALGRENVLGVAMPGPYSSDHSREDAFELARRLGIRCDSVPIAPPLDGFRKVINPHLESKGSRPLGAVLPDLTEENLQSRVRGTLLMALSNRTGALVLTTGNKSELAVGYCTLYGDMNGGYAVLCDVSKMQVYALARWINATAATCGAWAGDPSPIPERSIAKPPSAELRPNQTDQDSLPPYDVLDAIIERHVERHESPARITRETGIDGATVSRVVRLIRLSEYKRKQLATGPKVTTVAFGTGRRYPIAQGWRTPSPPP